MATRILSLLLVTISVFSNTRADIYYIDSIHGSDNWTGTAEVCNNCDPSSTNNGPWKSINKVNNSIFSPGDSVLFLCGRTWREQLRIPSSGSSQNPITYGTHPAICTDNDGPARISGAAQITGWTQYLNNTYVARTNITSQSFNVLENNTFDTSIAEWGSTLPPSPNQNGGAFNWSSIDANNSEGSGSLKFTTDPNTGTQHIRSSPIQAKPGDTYQIQFKIRTDPGKTFEGVTARFAGGSPWTVFCQTVLTINENWSSIDSSINAWSANCTIPSDGSVGSGLINGTFYIYASPTYQSQGPVTLYLDDVKVINISTTPSTVRQVYVDGEFISLAHHPNQLMNEPNQGSAYLKTASNSGTSYATKPGQNYLYAQASDTSNFADEIIGAGIHIRTTAWSIEDRTVTDFDPGANIIRWASNTDYSILENWGYYLDNKLWMLDSEGEWYYEADPDKPDYQNLYIWLPDGSDPNTHTIEASTSDFGIYASYKSNIVIDGIAIEQSSKNNINLNHPGSFSINKVTSNYSGANGIYISDDGATGNAYTRSIENATVSNSIRQGIYLYKASGIDIANNTVINSGTIGNPINSEGAITSGTQSSDINIQGNIISNSGYAGIKFRYSNSIGNNLIESSCLVLDDCGAIYTFNGATSDYFDNNGIPRPGVTIPPLNSQIFDNVINKVDAGLDGTPYSTNSNAAIYLDNLSNAVIVSGNTASNTGSGLHANNPFNNTIQGNTFYAASDSSINFVEGYGAPAGISRDNIIENNVIFQSGTGIDIRLTNIADNQTDFGYFSANSHTKLYSNKTTWEKNETLYPDRSYPHYKAFTLDEWEAQRSQGNGSTTTPPFSIAPFDFESMGADLLDLHFDSDTSSYRPVPVNGSGQVFWRSESMCHDNQSGGCIEFIPTDTSDTSTTPTSTMLDANTSTFRVNAGSNYLITFRLFSTHAHHNLVLRVIGSNWNDIGFLNSPNYAGLSNGKFFTSDPEWRTYSYVFTASETTDAKVNLWSRILPASGASVFVDDIRVTEVTGSFNDTNDDSYILSNPTPSNMTVACPDITIENPNPTRCAEYIYLDGSSVYWSDTLPPYSSKIIVWANNPNRDSDYDTFSDSDDNCPYIANIYQQDTNKDGIGDACDRDNDGYAAPLDCDDLEPTIHPGAPDIIRNGIDEDCNGYDLTIQNVTIKFKGRDKIKVYADSTYGQDANLQLDGFGAMGWFGGSTGESWVYDGTYSGPKPQTVTVSGPEGSVTVPAQ